MKDPVKSAKAVSLVYTNDHESDGITRRKRGKKYVYYNGDEKIVTWTQHESDPEEQKRIAEKIAAMI